MGVFKSRERSVQGIYHIMNRGVDKRNIFLDKDDKYKFLKLLEKVKVKEEIDFKILAYCLMGNHFHILIKDEEYNINRIMKYVCSVYAKYFNKKYDRVGHLFQGNYVSKAVNTYESVKRVVRYIHLNPIEAGYVEQAIDYKWSSYHEYFLNGNICNIKEVCEHFKVKGNFSIEKFGEYHKQVDLVEDDEFYNFEDLDSLENLIEYAKKVLGNIDLVEIQHLKKIKRDIYIEKLKESGLKLKEIKKIINIDKLKLQKPKNLM